MVVTRQQLYQIWLITSVVLLLSRSNPDNSIWKQGIVDSPTNWRMLYTTYIVRYRVLTAFVLCDINDDDADDDDGACMTFVMNYNSDGVGTWVIFLSFLRLGSVAK